MRVQVCVQKKPESWRCTGYDYYYNTCAGPGQLHKSGGAPGLEPEYTDDDEQTARGLDEAMLL